MDENLYSECDKFIVENKRRYERLLNEVIGLAKHIQELDSLDRLYRIYSRKDNKNEDSDFKKISKVAEKLAKWRKNYNEKSRVEDLHDIIGITIVVRYNSDIETVYLMIKNACQAKNLRVVPYLSPDRTLPAEESRQYKKFGYHALHLVLCSTNLALGGLKCEVQIKTLLHDAWGAKTYSLVYKPPGELPDELRTIMDGFGESIQALEVQSELVRTIITRDWDEENELRYAARLTMLSGLEEKGFDDKQLEGKYRNTFLKIQNNQSLIKNCDPDDSIIKELLEEVELLKQQPCGLAAAWPLMMYLASCRLDNQLNYVAKKYVQEWAREAFTDLAEKLFYESSTLYVIGERAEAIRLIRLFLMDASSDSVTIVKLRLNILYYLIEDAVYSSHRAGDIKAECDRIMQQLPFGDLNTLADEKMRCAAVDTLGYYKIVFGETKNEIEQGIQLCQKAYPEGAAAKMGGYYGILHQRTGWRRYLRARH